MKRIIDYTEAEEIVRKDLEDIEIPFIQFCEKHSLNYRYALQIRNKKNSKPYPKLVKKLLSIFYTLNSYHIIHQYSIDDKDSNAES